MVVKMLKRSYLTLEEKDILSVCLKLLLTIRPPVVRRVDNALHQINHYPVDSIVCFVNTYPVESDLSGG